MYRAKVRRHFGDASRWAVTCTLCTPSACTVLPLPSDVWAVAATQHVGLLVAEWHVGLHRELACLTCGRTDPLEQPVVNVCDRSLFRYDGSLFQVTGQGVRELRVREWADL